MGGQPPHAIHGSGGRLALLCRGGTSRPLLDYTLSPGGRGDAPEPTAI